MFSVGESVWCIPLKLWCQVNRSFLDSEGQPYCECFYVDDQSRQLQSFTLHEIYLAHEQPNVA